eukprot:804388_1
MKTITRISQSIRRNAVATLPSIIPIRCYLPSQRTQNDAKLLPYYWATMRPNTTAWTINNRNGFIQCGVAENHLSINVLKDKIKSSQNEIEIIDKTLFYSAGNHPPLQQSLSSFIFKNIATSYKLNPNHLVIGAGCVSLFAPLFHSISEFNDIILVPSPFFAGFHRDLTLMSGVQLIPVPTYPQNDYNIDPEELNKLLAIHGDRIKGLMFTSPSNPLGKVYDTQQIKSIFEWCVAHSVHFIADELFALCRINSNVDFVSTVDCCFDVDGFDRYFHHVYGLSKDFGLSGLRIASHYTQNNDIRNALKKYHFSYNVPVHTQQLAHQILSDVEWCSYFIQQNQCKIQQRYAMLAAYLKEYKISHYVPDYGLFVWLDFSEDLQKYSTDIRDLYELEKRLYFIFLKEQKLSLAPGECFECKVPGFFRLCFTSNEATESMEDTAKRIYDGINDFHAQLE